MFQFPGEIKMSLCLHDTKRPVNSIKNNSQFGVGRTQLVRLGVCHHGRKKNNQKQQQKTKQNKKNWLAIFFTFVFIMSIVSIV